MSLTAGLDIIFDIFARFFTSILNFSVFGVSFGIVIIVTFVIRHVFLAVFDISYSNPQHMKKSQSSSSKGSE